MRLSSLRKLSETLLFLRDEKEVHGGGGVNVLKGEAQIVLVDNLSRNFLGDDGVENRGFRWLSRNSPGS